VDNSQPAYLGERGFGDDKKKKRKGPDNRVLVENEV
jgi:hypothetical protein